MDAIASRPARSYRVQCSGYLASLSLRPKRFFELRNENVTREFVETVCELSNGGKVVGQIGLGKWRQVRGLFAQPLMIADVDLKAAFNRLPAIEWRRAECRLAKSEILIVFVADGMMG